MASRMQRHHQRESEFEMTAFTHILVPTDFGEPSQRALDFAVKLSQKFDAALTLLHTYEIPTYAYSGMSFTTVGP